MGNTRWAAPSRPLAAAMAMALAVVAAACAGGDASDETATTSTDDELASCADDRHVVAFDYFGTITLADSDLGAWGNETPTTPQARPGAADVANAYRDRGYEVLYLTTAPEEITIAGSPIRLVIADWLVGNGFPLSDSAGLWVWDGTQTPMRGIAAEFDRLVAEGVSLDAAYTDNEDKAFAFKTAVPSDGVFTLGTGSGASGVTPVPNDDMTAHAATVAALPPVCRRA